MSENKPTGCNIAAKALNRAGVKSDDGKPWTEEKLETIWRGIPPSVLKFLRLLNENGMPPEHAMSLHQYDNRKRGRSRGIIRALVRSLQKRSTGKDRKLVQADLTADASCVATE